MLPPFPTPSLKRPVAMMLACALALPGARAAAATPPPGTPSAPMPASVAKASAPTTGLQLVQSLLRQPRLLTRPWAAMRSAWPDDCIRHPTSTDLNCPAMIGVQWASVQEGPRGIVNVALAPPISCDALYQVIRPRFGPGRLEHGDRCSAHWDLSRWVKGGYIDVSRHAQEPGQLLFQLAIEQGP